MNVADLKVKIFADGADLAAILELHGIEYISGFTTNPTLMRQAGVRGYEAFGRELLEAVPDRPISLEVLSDDLAEMEQQAVKIASWGDNAYVKIPVTTTRGESTAGIVRGLSGEGVQVNVTAVLTRRQVDDAVSALAEGARSFVSVFAGRVADTGTDPLPLMRDALRSIRAAQNSELIWASPREILNVVQAEEIGCHVITVTHELLKKLNMLGYDHDELSLDTVKMFRRDALGAGYTI
jgi:transaldolase